MEKLYLGERNWLNDSVVKKLVHTIVNTGIYSDTPFYIRNKLKVFNNANLVVFLISIFYLCVGLSQHFYLACIVTMYSVLSTILSFVLIRRKYYRAAFHYTMAYAFLFISSYSLLFGTASNTYYYFLFMPVVCNILFDSLGITLFYLVLSILFILANVVVVEQYPSYYKVDNWLHYLGYPNIAFASMLIFLGVRLFKQENFKYAAQIETQRKILEEKNTEITDSINYAKKIQHALIPTPEEFGSFFKESFVMLTPKDIVSGDFYWITQKGDKIFYATADCTGHGVPGGFMTMLGISFLDEIVTEKNVEEPAEVLNILRERIIQVLKQTGTAGESKDGMDIVLCCLDKRSGALKYAAANNSLYVIRDKKMTEYKPDKQPCGFYHEAKPFTQHTVKLEAGDHVFTFTDGYADQFGGPKGKKFKYRQLEELLLSNIDKPLKTQKSLLDSTFTEWKKELEQVDDVLVIGIGV